MDVPCTKSLEYDCGIALRRIQEWLEDELELEQGERDTYLFESEGSSCHVRIQALENRTVGRVSIERTNMRIEGDSTAVDAYMHLFTLRFISAGG